MRGARPVRAAISAPRHSGYFARNGLLLDGSAMKPRHAVALALVSWYLLVPPLVNAPYKVDTEAPLTSWKVYQTFDTREECDKSLLAVHAKYKPTATAPIGTIKKGTRAFALQMTFARCVSTDDPRLKAK